MAWRPAAGCALLALAWHCAAFAATDITTSRLHVTQLESRWREQPPGPTTPIADLSALDTLADALRAVGRYEDARTLREQLWRASAAQRGERDPATLALMAARVQVEMEAERKLEALPIAEQVVRLRTEVLGPRDPGTLMSVTDLAECLILLRRPDDALRAIQPALVLQQEVLGEKHAQTLDSIRVQAQALQGLGREQEALPLAEKVLRLRTEAGGEDDADTLEAMVNLGLVYGSVRRDEERNALFQKAWRHRIRTLGEMHPTTLGSMFLVASTIPSATRRDERISLQQRLLQLSTDALGAEHPKTLIATRALTLSERPLKGNDETIRRLEQLILVATRTLGAGHLQTLDLRQDLAFVLGESGQVDQQLALAEAVVKTRREVYGDWNIGTQLALHNLAWNYLRAGRHESAVMWGEQVLELRTTTLGEAHPWTMLTLVNLGEAYGALGRFDDVARLTARRLVAIRATKGAVHKDTLDATFDLARRYRDLGREREALALLPHYRESAEGLVRASAAGQWPAQTFADMAPAYGLFSTLQGNAGNFEAGWLLAELAKRHYTLFYAGLDRARKARQLPPADQDALDALFARVAAVRRSPAESLTSMTADPERRKTVADLLVEMDSLAVRLIKEVPGFAELARPRLVNPQELAALLAPDEVVLNYVAQGQNVAVWFVDAAGVVRFYPLGEIRWLGNAVWAHDRLRNKARYRAQALANGRPEVTTRIWLMPDGGVQLRSVDLPKPAQGDEVLRTADMSVWLGRRLLEPLAEHLRDNRSWLVSLSGSLQGLRMDDLLLDDQPAGQGRRIRYVPSVSLYALDPDTAQP